MKKRLAKIVISAMLALFAKETATAQGFVNLDFESARVIPLPDGQANFPPYSVATTNAVPGWTVFYGANQQTQITYNDPALGSTFVTLWATNGEQLSGNYSVLLQGGASAPFAAITQTGQVPVTAQSLLFIADGSRGTLSAFQVSLGGQQLSIVAISNALNYTVFGADVSAFAGRTEQLMFSALDISGVNDWNIDNIQFSTLPVPEPSELALVALGALIFGFHRWRNSSR